MYMLVGPVVSMRSELGSGVALGGPGVSGLVTIMLG